MNDTFYKITALAILAVFYGCYLIKMLLQRSKGIRTDQMGFGKSGTALRVEIVMKIAAALVPVAELLSIFLVKRYPPAPIRIAGVVIGILGDAVFIISVATMRDSWRAGVSEMDRTELVTDGIYSISRNPAFLAFDFVYLGILCMYFNWPLLAVSVFAAVMFHLQIVLVEEIFLLRAFGEQYASYKRRVNRYLDRRSAAN